MRGQLDDQVDALGLIGQLLDTIRPGHVPKPAPKPCSGGVRRRAVVVWAR